ncbi:MAG: Glu-tRNA(Gln) amidotransferase subunit GatE [Saccharolobus sp.]
MSDLDYEKLGLKVGLEIHQQLNTSHKLFCNCKTELEEKYISSLERYLRPTLSELGEVDVAALFEWKRGRKYIYKIPINTSCEVEADEEPPHNINDEALKIALAIGMALKSNIVDEVYTMRKIVIDGSNTTGFQRTAIVAIGGILEDENVTIQTIALEEDAARKIKEDPEQVEYSLDRLGIPLIEISTGPDIKSPEQAERVALKIGQLLRMTGKVKRGIGTIRQDLNVSIKGGTKIEIKGVQKLEMIAEIVKNEAVRQLNLLKIKEELKNRGLTKEDIIANFYVKDVTEIFKNTKSKIIKNEIEKGAIIYCIKLYKLKGILGWELVPKKRRFGTEIADYVRALAGLGGIFHSDELPNYGITNDELNKVRDVLNIMDEDAFIIIVGEKEKLDKAKEVIKDRILAAFDGVPKETRAALDDGTTKYLRPQPGAARMYPETDIPPRRIDNKLLEEAKKLVPESPEAKIKRYISLGLNEELAKEIIRNPRLDLFEEFINKFSPKVQASVIASTLTNTLKYVKSKGGDISKITDNDLEEIFRNLYEGKIAKDSITEILLEYTTNKDIMSISEIINKYKLISTEELEQIIDEVIKSNKDEIDKRKEKAVNIVMGKVMAKVRGKADGKIVAELIRSKLKNLIG